jgi:hypothetical protein
MQIIKFIKKKLIIFFPKEFFMDDIAKPLFIKSYIKIRNDIKIQSFGRGYPNKIFYVIQRSPGAGFFSNVTYVLNHLIYCKKKKYIPIVDMKNFTTIYNERYKINNTYNAWNYYFKSFNKYKLREVYQSKKVIFSNNKYLKKINFFCHKIPKINKFFNIKNIWPFLVKEAYLFIKNNFKKNERILGVHFRGTTYKRAKNHSFPPTPKIISKKIDELLIKFKYDKIFLVTEEEKYLNFIKKKYGNKCIYINSYRSNNIDAFKIYPRKKHRYLLGKEILVETLILSKCNGMLYQPTNVSSAAIMFKKKKIKLHKIILGYNSSNIFIARWKWYLKMLLPPFLGGLHIK